MTAAFKACRRSRCALFATSSEHGRRRRQDKGLFESVRATRPAVITHLPWGKDREENFKLSLLMDFFGVICTALCANCIAHLCARHPGENRVLRAFFSALRNILAFLAHCGWVFSPRKMAGEPKIRCRLNVIFRRNQHLSSISLKSSSFKTKVESTERESPITSTYAAFSANLRGHLEAAHAGAYSFLCILKSC